MKTINKMENLTPEEQANRPNLNMIQKVYCVCGLMYFGYWIRSTDGTYLKLVFDLDLFIVTSAFILISAPIILIYNHRNETYPANKRLCNLVALVSVGIFVHCLWNYVLP